jgi:hypothetical protein
MLRLGVGTTVPVLMAFGSTALVDEPAAALALACILGLSVVLTWWWKRIGCAPTIMEEAT